MQEKNLIKYIRQVENQIKDLREASMDDALRKEHIERNTILRKYYTRQLKQLKWDWLLTGNSVESLFDEF